MTTVARRTEHDSGEFSDASHQENEQDTSRNGVPNDESDYDSAASDSERSERDPENQETERRVDDDEDRSNPQYIPKRGTFYEHDDRTAASGGEESTNTVSETASEKKEGETPSERRRAARKSETVNKWSHDKYNENEQMPKSRDELVAIYGYDIRNEDAPPHARRNRRYGRGPNKYTRTWEDEEAYKRQANAVLPARKPPNPEDFPELEAGGKSGRKRVPRPRSKSQPSSTESIENGTPLRRNASIKDRARTKRPPARTPGREKKETKEREGQKENREKLPPLENLTITATVVNNSQSQPVRKVNATVAQQRPVPTDQGKKRPPAPVPVQPAPALAAPSKSPPAGHKPQAPHEPRASKRYSSLRQRPLDTYSPPHQHSPQPAAAPAQQHRYHAGEYPPSAGQQGTPHPQQLMQQIHRNAPVSQHGPSPPHQQLPQQSLPQQQQPLPQPQIQQQQIQQQQISQQQISQQQMSQQQISQQQISQQQISQQQISQQQISQQQISQQQISQQQISQQQISQQQISQQQISQQQISQQQQQVRLGILEQQQMVSHPHHTIHNMPPPPVPQHTIAQLQPSQAYAPPAMMPAQYMQQGVSGAAFGGAAMYAQPPAPYPHQLYQHHNYVSSPGGLTYYSCAEQEPPPRPQRRPTAAIPIVRPAAPDRSANSTEKDNIDRIVENMFVRKPWPSTHSADSKEKSEARSSQEPPSKESSQPNSLTSSSISTDSKPSDSIEKEKEDKEPVKEVTEPQKESTPVIEAEKEAKISEEIKEESISTDA